MNSQPVFVYKGEALAAYGFGEQHPFGPDRHDAFHEALERSGFHDAVTLRQPAMASVEQLSMFHDEEYIRHVERRSDEGTGFLDHGDTPALPGIFQSARVAVGTTLAAVDAIVSGETRCAFQPIGGLHHAARGAAAGFCVFNDCGVAIEYLRRRHGISRIAYVDIDAHHGDGVYYGFEDDPDLCFADIHEDGRFLYPGTGAACEVGVGPAAGSKLNLPLPPGADNALFFDAWRRVEEFVDAAEPEFIILQCGADSLGGDPITHLRFTDEAHAVATASLLDIADRYAEGRLLATGGGGYNRANIAAAWTAVVGAMARAD